MATMTEEQYQRWSRAKKLGDDDMVKDIEAEGYGGRNKGVIEAEVIEPEPDKALELPSAGTIAELLDEGKSRVEIGKIYGISHQKVSAIEKGGE